MQVEDMVRHLSLIATKKGTKLLSDEREYLQAAAELLRTLDAEKQELVKELAKERSAACKRERLPDDRKSLTRKFNIRAGEPGDEPLKVYATLGHYDDGRPGELFLRCDKQGSLLSGAFDAVALSISVGLQYGIPLGVYTDKLIGSRFEPAGFTGDKKYPVCTSVLDLVARWLKDVSA